MCRCPSKPRNATRSQASSPRPTGQPGRQVERATTRSGAGSVMRAAYPGPGSEGSSSGSVKRRVRRDLGVRRTSPKPVDASGSTRAPSQGGGVVPGPDGCPGAVLAQRWAPDRWARRSALRTGAPRCSRRRAARWSGAGRPTRSPRAPHPASSSAAAAAPAPSLRAPGLMPPDGTSGRADEGPGAGARRPVRARLGTCGTGRGEPGAFSGWPWRRACWAAARSTSTWTSPAAPSVARRRRGRADQRATRVMVGRAPDLVECPENLEAEVGASVRCTLVDGEMSSASTSR